MSVASIEELRSANRVGVRTPVVVYYLDPRGQMVRCRAWTDDLSSTGARITTEHPLSASQFYMRVMLPNLKDQVIQCALAREIRAKRDFGNMFDIRRSYYGVQFVGLADVEALSQVEAIDNHALGR
jgi:PilZ domain